MAGASEQKDPSGTGSYPRGDINAMWALGGQWLHKSRSLEAFLPLTNPTYEDSGFWWVHVGPH